MNMEVRREQRAQVTIPTKEVFKCRVLTMVPHTCHQENNPGRTLKGLFLLKDIFRKDTLVQKKFKIHKLHLLSFPASTFINYTTLLTLHLNMKTN